ncbi:MAG TPA: superoxide dismutase [Cu-Zn] SodC [Arenimonas sp.]|nr:superoxide dismutase [Cu-Zn] SodC [Arenimonas sp.]
MKTQLITFLLASSGLAGVHAADRVVSMDLVDTAGKQAWVGEVTVSETPYGLLFTPQLRALPPGLHGFHLHENPSCGPKEKDGKPVAALAAGGHYDPAKTGRHDSPWGDGHLGDLPPLFVDAEGSAIQPVLAPRLKMADIGGRALMLHAGGDNHADHPAPLGGGGARIACGVIE